MPTLEAYMQIKNASDVLVTLTRLFKDGPNHSLSPIEQKLKQLRLLSPYDGCSALLWCQSLPTPVAIHVVRGSLRHAN